MQRPADLTPENIPLVRRPSQGGEFQVFLSPQEAFEVGSVSITGSNAGTFTADTGYAVSLADRPSDLIVLLENGRKTGGPISVHVVGTDQNDAALSGNAVLEFPAWAGVSDEAFPTGFASEVLVTDGTKRFKTVSLVTVLASESEATDAKLIVLGMPNQSTYERVGCTTSKEIETPSRVGRAMPCEMNGSAFTGAGRSKAGSLTISAQDTGPASLARFDGMRTVAQIRVVHESREARRIYMTGHYVSVRNSAPDGEEVANHTSQGPFERYAYMLPLDA